MDIDVGYYYLMVAFTLKWLFADNSFSTFTSLFVLILPVILYQLAFEILMNGQTPGKRLIGIKIMDKEGQEPTWGQYVIRWALNFGNILLYVLPKYMLFYPGLIGLFLFIYLPDVILILATRKGQKLGDLAAGTVVIDNQFKADITDTIYQQIEVREYQVRYPQVMKLTDRDLNSIRSLLTENRRSKANDQYVQQVVAKIKVFLAIDTPMEGHEFLQQLLLDYNYLTGNTLN